jgi:hypothetical protein
MRILESSGGRVVINESRDYRKQNGRLNLGISIALSVIFILASTENSQAQQTPIVRAYRSDRSDEDWSFLRDGSLKKDFWDPLKYISLGEENRYLTLSGEIRFRPEGFRVRGLEGGSSTSDGYLLQRYLVGADLHLSPRFRIFSEIQSGIATGKLRSPRPTDQNTLDLHQAFFEWRQPLKNRRVFAFKIGRQEVEIGSSRLISASPGLNVKRSFDGVVFSYRSDSWRLGAVAAKLVSISKGNFDDRPDHEQTFWGMAASRKSFLFKQGEFALYYLGLDRARTVYVQGFGREQRHTAGVKWMGSGARADINYDAILQWGAFNDAPIRSWAFSTETGYRFINTRWKPRLSIRADIASGDKDPNDPRLQSFNPLFPGNSYAGAVGLLGPTNLTDLTPTVTFLMPKRIVLGFEAPSYWRNSSGDGVYNTNQGLILPPGVGQGKYVGTNPGIIAVWQATTHLQFQGAITRFLSGSFLERTFVANGFGFYSATALYRF